METDLQWQAKRVHSRTPLIGADSIIDTLHTLHALIIQKIVQLGQRNHMQARLPHMGYREVNTRSIPRHKIEIKTLISRTPLQQRTSNITPPQPHTISITRRTERQLQARPHFDINFFSFHAIQKISIPIIQPISSSTRIPIQHTRGTSKGVPFNELGRGYFRRPPQPTKAEHKSRVLFRRQSAKRETSYGNKENEPVTLTEDNVTFHEKKKHTHTHIFLQNLQIPRGPTHFKIIRQLHRPCFKEQDNTIGIDGGQQTPKAGP